MKRFAKLFLLSITLGIAFSSVNAQKLDISQVTTIEVNIACQLILVQGNSPNIEIVGDSKAVADVETRIKNGKLTLRSDRKKWDKEDVVVKIEIKDLKHLNIGGAVDMKTVKTLVLEDFGMSISGVGNIEMQLECKRFKLNCSGVGNIDLSGKTDDMHISVSGVGNVRASDFLAVTAKVVNSGVGRVNVHVEEDLDAKVSGIGSISYAGSPSVRSNVSGLGRISRH